MQLLMKNTAALMMIATLATPLTAAADDQLAAIQGTWTRTETIGGGKTQTWTKHIEGNKETITIRDESGKVTTAWVVDFAVTQTDNVRLFTFRNFTITEGNDAGKVIEGVYSYLYRLKGDKFYEVQGMLVEDKLPNPRFIIWQRMD
jgi:hypothetical protein